MASWRGGGHNLSLVFVQDHGNSHQQWYPMGSALNESTGMASRGSFQHLPCTGLMQLAAAAVVIAELCTHSTVQYRVGSCCGCMSGAASPGIAMSISVYISLCAVYDAAAYSVLLYVSLVQYLHDYMCV